MGVGKRGSLWMWMVGHASMVRAHVEDVWAMLVTLVPPLLG